MTTHRQDAKATIVHYFRLLFEKAGLKVSTNNVTEWESIVDNMLEAMTDELAGRLAGRLLPNGTHERERETAGERHGRDRKS